MPARPHPRLVTFLSALALFLLAWVVFAQYHPFDRTLEGDAGVYAYIAQGITLGHAPYRTTFDILTGLSMLLGASALWVGSALGIEPLIAIRLYTLTVSALVVALTFLVAQQFFGRRLPAWIAALIMLGWSGFALSAALGMQPKTLMVLCGLSALYLAARRRLFWAGVFAGGAALAWQIGILYGICLVLQELWSESGSPRGPTRRRALLSLAGGAAIPIAGYALFYIAMGAFRDMLEQTLLVPPMMRRSVHVLALNTRLRHMLNRFMAGYGSELGFGVLAAAGWALYLAPQVRNTLRELRRTRRVAIPVLRTPSTGGVLLAFHAFFLFSLLDFQNYPDWIPLLPYLSMFAAYPLWRATEWLAARVAIRGRAYAVLAALVCSAVLVAAVWDLPSQTERRLRGEWRAQKAWAEHANAILPAGAPLFLLGRTELLFLMERRNLSRIVLLGDRFDAAVELIEPGGYDGWLGRLRAARPEVVAHARLKHRKFADPDNMTELREWIETEYVPIKPCGIVGKGKYYVRRDLADELASFWKCPPGS